MDNPNEEHEVSMELLTRLGSRWTVLAAMSKHMSNKGVEMPPAIGEKLKVARIEIASGCFSPCEVACALADVESQLFSRAYLLGDDDFMEWSGLLGEAMQGKLTYERIQGISALVPVRNDCAFLGCTCSEAASRRA